MTALVSTIVGPKLKRFSEKRDLSSLSNLESWCKSLSIEFERDVLNKNEKSEKTLRRVFNAYPLILAYQNKMQESEDFLKGIIAYWSKEYKKENNVDKLSNLIDPSINLLRLYKLKKRTVNSVLY